MSCGKYTNFIPFSFSATTSEDDRERLCTCSMMDGGRSVPDRADSAFRRSAELSIWTPWSRSHCSRSVGVMPSSLLMVVGWLKEWLEGAVDCGGKERWRGNFWRAAKIRRNQYKVPQAAKDKRSHLPRFMLL